MTSSRLARVDDWNASDAARGVARPGILGRVGLPPRVHARRALKEAGARHLRDGEQPRFRNLAEGLAARASSGAPDLWLLTAGGPNAIGCRFDRPVVAVSESLLDLFTRTEIEAVVAHCLVRNRTAGRKGALVGYDDDVRAAALTRYPPALASAVQKAEPYRGRYGAFYFVAEGSTHRAVTERAEALLDL